MTSSGGAGQAHGRLVLVGGNVEAGKGKCLEDNVANKLDNKLGPSDDS